jgi:hypothetical protein
LDCGFNLNFSRGSLTKVTPKGYDLICAFDLQTDGSGALGKRGGRWPAGAELSTAAPWMTSPAFSAFSQPCTKSQRKNTRGTRSSPRTHLEPWLGPREDREVGSWRWLGVARGKIQNARSKARGLGFGDPKAKRRPRGCPRGYIGVSLRENGKEIANFLGSSSAWNRILLGLEEGEGDALTRGPRSSVRESERALAAQLGRERMCRGVGEKPAGCGG